MNKHSSGPWRYKLHSVDSNYMLIFCSNDPHEGDNLRGYCGEDNARLIAAAPDLLAALQMLLEFPNTGPATTAARAAIAKATGDNT